MLNAAYAAGVNLLSGGAGTDRMYGSLAGGFSIIDSDTLDAVQKVASDKLLKDLLPSNVNVTGYFVRSDGTVVSIGADHAVYVNGNAAWSDVAKTFSVNSGEYLYILQTNGNLLKTSHESAKNHPGVFASDVRTFDVAGDYLYVQTNNGNLFKYSHNRAKDYPGVFVANVQAFAVAGDYLYVQQANGERACHGDGSCARVRSPIGPVAWTV